MVELARLEAFHRQDPDNSALACELADALLSSGRVEQVREMLSALSPQLRADPCIRFWVARCALVDGKLADAAEVLESLQHTTADGPAVRHDLAFVQLATGKVDAASMTLAPALADPEAPAEVHVLHARLLHWHGDFPGGLDAIEKALAIAPDNVEARGVQALLLLDQGDRDAARKSAEMAVVGDELQPEALIVLGTLALWEQRPNEAESSFTRVLAHQPQAGRALLGLGQVQMLRGNLAAASGSLQQAVENMPGHIGSWHALAWCRLLAGDVAAAQTSYERALGLDRTFGETHGGLAIVHALRGEFGAAEAEIKRARKLDPKGRSAVYARALLCMADGREDEAKHLVAPLLAGTGTREDPLEVLRRLRARMQGR